MSTRSLPPFSDLLSFLQDLLSGRRSNAEFSTTQLCTFDIKKYMPIDKPLTILDLANGSLRPQSEILSREGHAVVGIDYVNKPTYSLTSILYIFARILFRRELPKPATIKHIRT